MVRIDWRSVTSGSSPSLSYLSPPSPSLTPLTSPSCPFPLLRRPGCSGSLPVRSGPNSRKGYWGGVFLLGPVTSERRGRQRWRKWIRASGFNKWLKCRSYKIYLLLDPEQMWLVSRLLYPPFKLLLFCFFLLWSAGYKRVLLSKGEWKCRRTQSLSWPEGVRQHGPRSLHYMTEDLTRPIGSSPFFYLSHLSLSKTLILFMT